MKRFIGLNSYPMLALAAMALFSAGYANAQTATPFNGFRFGLPATIECEHFDIGGQSIGYFYTTAGEGRGAVARTGQKQKR